MKIRLLFCLLLIAASSIHALESECRTPDGGTGLCRDLGECPATRRSTQEDLTSVCHGSGLEKYCCSDCTTPNGKSGVVKSLLKCPPLLKLYHRKQPGDLIHISRSRIGTTYNVCCDSFGAEQLQPSNAECDAKIGLPPDPSSKCCGIDASIGERIIGGNRTKINAYTWSVLLEYIQDGRLFTHCGGALITNKHVVTAAYCVMDPPQQVRIGEFNQENDEVDCDFVTRMCNGGTKVIAIEDFVQHPDFSAETGRNDIALIRLKEAVQYSVFVRPICLPSSDFSKNNVYINGIMEFQLAGWGQESNVDASGYKKDVALKLVNIRDCQNAYKFRVWNTTIQLWEKQLCAGGERGKNSCNAELGGALVGKGETGEHLELAGLVSRGTNRCAVKGLPGIYTNVYQYVDWIQQTVRNGPNSFIDLWRNG